MLPRLIRIGSIVPVGNARPSLRQEIAIAHPPGHGEIVPQPEGAKS